MLGEELNFENIVSGDEIEELFSTTPEDTVDDPEEGQQDNKKQETTEVNADTLFGKVPEGVSSEEEEDNQEGEGAKKDKDSGTSPDSNFYSSIATALRDEGILPDLDDEELKKIKSPEEFAEAVEKQLQSKLDEKQRRVDEALSAGIEVTEIKRYENTLNFLDSIDDDTISDESEKGENLRKNLIYQDFVNRGFSEARAKREMEKSFSAGTDLEDAKEALNSNKEFFKKDYQRLVDEAKTAEKAEQEAVKKQQFELEKAILSDDAVFGDIKLDKLTKQKVLANLTKPAIKGEDGNYYTAIQKAQRDDSIGFMKKLGVIFTLTDGFKNLDGLVKGKVTKETRRSLRELEHVLNNTSRNSSGNLAFVSGVGGEEDPNSKIGLNLDV